MEMKTNATVFEYLIMCHCLCRKKIVKDHKKWVASDRKDIVLFKGFCWWQYVTYSIAEWIQCRACDPCIPSSIPTGLLSVHWITEMTVITDMALEITGMTLKSSGMTLQIH